MFRVDGIDHLELFVPDRREAARWYERVLGLTVVARCEHWSLDPRGPLMISSDEGRTMLALFTGEPQGEAEPRGLRRAAFRVGGRAFLEFLGRFSELGLTDPQGRPPGADPAVDHGAAWSVYFCDPWGNRLEVTTYETDVVARGLEKS